MVSEPSICIRTVTVSRLYFYYVFVGSLCPPKFVYFNGSCFSYHPPVERRLVHSLAQQFCEAEYGSNLASIHSAEEQWLIYYMIISSGKPISYGIWTGAVREGNSWNWTDGTPFDYPLTWSSYPFGQEPSLGYGEIYAYLS